jgi:hypothetical protein
VKGLKATLYVKGVKTAIGVDDRSHEGYVVQTMSGGKVPYVPPRVISDYKEYVEPEYKSILPEDQKALVEMVEAAAVKYGFELTVIDVTEKSFLHKLEDRLKGISTFPALITDCGLKIEGDITEERIKALFAKQRRSEQQSSCNSF